MVINKYVVMMLKKELVSGECMRGIIFVSTECLFFLLSFIFLYFRSTSISLRIIYMKERKSTKMKSHMSCIINEAMIQLLRVFLLTICYSSVLESVFTWPREEKYFFISSQVNRTVSNWWNSSHLHLTRRRDEMKTYHIIENDTE